MQSGVSDAVSCMEERRRVRLLGARHVNVTDDGAAFLDYCERILAELEEARRHALLLSRRRAISKLAMFLQFLEQLRGARGEKTAEIYLPMSRSDVGEYIGTTLAAVSRAFGALTAPGIIKVRNRRHVKIVDHYTFDKMTRSLSFPYQARSLTQIKVFAVCYG